VGVEKSEPADGPIFIAQGKKSASFLGVPLQRWAVVAISLVAVVYAAGYAFISLQQKYNAERAKAGSLETQAQGLQRSLATVTQSTERRISEAEKHTKVHDPYKTISIDSSDGHPVVADYYSSDGCLHIKRSHGGATLYGISDTQDLWIPDPSRQNNAKLPVNPPDDITEHRPSKDLKAHQAPNKPILREVSLHAGKARIKRVQAGCVNPHPWPFRSWWGPANGCFAPLYRQWNDGCVHYQVYNACSGIWDPNIYWTFCSAQHHP
jgi:hypothetical protein